MDRVFVWPPSEELDVPESYVGVVIERLSDGGWHTGVLYRTPQSGPNVLHLMGHYGGSKQRRFRHENPRPSQLCVLCAVDEVEIPALRRIFLGIYRQNSSYGLPYGFTPPLGAWFEDGGRLVNVGPGRGLCCQTFVLAAYEAADLRLIDPPNAPARPDDHERQRSIFDRITERLCETQSRTKEHFAAVEADLGTALYRPLEVAGAAKAAVLPCSFAEALNNGEELEPIVPPPLMVAAVAGELTLAFPSVGDPKATEATG